jgi:sterol desaturase/sphingolipid hydroxylase (fatty acid hydroxylase superfamily)
MTELIQYFTNITTESRSLFLISGLAFFFILEFGIPLFKMKYSKGKHALINITFTIITLIVNLFGAALILSAVNYNESNHSGILNLVQMPLWLYVILGLVLMDLIGAWFIHWIEHKVKWLWKFHIIHHTDPNVDVTSGLRHHPGENIFRLLFTTLAVLITGASFGLIMLYQTISAFFAHLTHANIKMPLAIDKVLSYIFVTPHFHKVHHHYIQPHTDSNYGNIFSIWDHVFHTVTRVKKMDDLVYGIDTHMKPEEHSSIKNLLMIPFQAYRPPVGSKFSK